MSNSTVTYSHIIAILKSHKGATTPDIAVVLKEKGAFSFTEKTFNYGVELGVDFELLAQLPQKQVKRGMQLINALHSAAYKSIDYTHARILIAMHLAGDYDLTTDAITSLASGKRSGEVNTRGISVSSVNALFAQSHGLSTVKTKLSNSVGKNGIYQALGISWGNPGEKNRAILLNRDSQIFKRFLHLINVATPGQLSEMMGEDK